MKKRAATRRPRKPDRRISDEQQGQLAQLAKLGVTVTPRDAARIIGVEESAVSTFLAGREGSKLWKRARSEGRAELLTVIRTQALDGDAAAQKLLTTLLERDDTIAAADIRIPAKELRELIGRSAATIGRRTLAGEFPPLSADNKYAVKSILETIPTLWDKLATARKRVARLETLTAEGQMEETEARRQASVEIARRRRRENDVAEGRLIERTAAEEEMRKLCDIVRTRAAEYVQDVGLALGLEPGKSAMADAARRAFLTRCANDMEAGR